MKFTGVIGVRANADEWEVVKEFFELFKTPWEAFIPGQSYDVLVVTTLDLNVDANARLIVVYGSYESAFDRKAGLTGRCIRSGEGITTEIGVIPIYGYARLFGCESRNLEHAIYIDDSTSHRRVVRVGFDLWSEIRFLITTGQPKENAALPTIDLHIKLLRSFILQAGLTLIEIPPSPARRSFITCLTHDIDFVYLRQHLFDHSMWGFVYRAIVGSMMDWATGHKRFSQLLRNWLAVIKLPFVYAGACRDFWQQFEGYLKLENGKPSTFFVIPFKGRSGTPMAETKNLKRATKYDISDIADWASRLQDAGCEVALHGIDAWCDCASGREEAMRILSFTGRKSTGVRMHWLYFSEKSPRLLDQAGFGYDSTSGYNDAIGFRCGTSQVFKPLTSNTLLELPMHIQDTALFYPGRLHLKEAEAWDCCKKVIDHAVAEGGVVTVLWHDRSLAPERLWGEFYKRILAELESLGTWFATAEQVSEWFRHRRAIKFVCRGDKPNEVKVCSDLPYNSAMPEFVVRVSALDQNGDLRIKDTVFSGKNVFHLSSTFSPSSETKVSARAA